MAERLIDWQGHHLEARIQKIGKEHILDYFRLAEKIRQMKPALQEKMDVLTSDARDPARSESERSVAKIQIDALDCIYATSVGLVKSFVNTRSYIPQIEDFRLERGKEFDKLSKQVFGIIPEKAFSGSWEGGGLIVSEVNSHDRTSMQYKKQESLVFESIKAMIRPQSTDE